MNIVRVNKNKEYTTISNIFLKDKNLSLKAKGFLAVVMSLSDNWDFTINGICAILKEGKSSVYTTIDELKKYGYCEYTRIRDEKGLIIGNDYTFNEKPKMVLQYIDNPYPENPNVDNQTQLNTNINNNINEIKKEDTIVSKKDEIDYAYIKKQWETICPMLASIRDLNPKRKKAIANTLKNNNADVDDMIKCFKIIASSEFCKGDNKQAWKATFDWIINDTKSCFNRLLEGEFSKNMYEHKLYESIMKGSDNSNDNVNKKILINGVEYK